MNLAITKTSAGYLLKSEQLIEKPLGEVFQFFSQAENLNKLTPDFIGFKIVTPLPIQMKVGATIDYRIIVRGIPIPWRTLISKWDPPFCFVDEQIRGPYRFWIHQHRFEDKNDKTLVLDTVNYLPIGGALIHQLFVKRDIMKIFSYREKKLQEIFS